MSEEFFEAYVEAALWSSVEPETDRPLGEICDGSDIAPETEENARRDCEAFCGKHGSLFAGREREAGYDFWLTRNRHGAGFWDGDWPEPDATVLTEAAKAFGEVDPYVGDDGKLYGLA